MKLPKRASESSESNEHVFPSNKKARFVGTVQ